MHVTLATQHNTSILCLKKRIHGSSLVSVFSDLSSQSKIHSSGSTDPKITVYIQCQHLGLPTQGMMVYLDFPLDFPS